jgi:LmbE family N-acetylglucosaminyl deacetylase
MAERTLMAIGAHADDIELNVGGTLAKYRNLGYRIVYVMATNNMAGSWHMIAPDGARSSTQPSCTEMMRRRREEATAAAAHFGTTPIFLDYPQRRCRDEDGTDVELRYGCVRPKGVPEGVPTILTAHEDTRAIQRLADLIATHNPEAVLCHGPVMVDLEHVATCLLVTRAYAQAAESGYEGMLLHWLDITPTIYGRLHALWETHIDVSLHHAEKLEVIGLHACQMPDPKRLDFPPIGAACGCEHAEAFTICAAGRCPPGAAFMNEIVANTRTNSYSWGRMS